jgi:hypothetical protein
MPVARPAKPAPMMIIDFSSAAISSPDWCGIKVMQQSNNRQCSSANDFKMN